jgi:PAS domain S-box-containing protein
VKSKNETPPALGPSTAPAAPSAEPSAAAALAASEARLELATSAAALGIWDWDLQTNKFIYSVKAREICGFADHGEVTYDMVRAATHPEDLPHTSAQAQRAIDPAIRSREPYEYRILLPDGAVRWVLAHGKAQFENREGVEHAVRYVGTLQDITDRHAQDHHNLELASRLKLALDASRMAVWEVDLATETLVGSPDLNRLFGLPADSNPDIATLRSYYYPGEQERVAEHGRKVLERGERYLETEYRIIRADHEVRWLGLRCELLRTEQGEPRRVIGVLWDVTERKGAELRDAVLAELTSRTRDLDDPDEISYAAAEVLGRTLGVSRAGYGTIDKAAETITIARDWNAPGITSLAGVLHFRDYGSYIEDLKRGQTVVFADAEKDPRTAATADALKGINAQALVNMPVTEQGGFAALLYLNQDTARAWAADELSLIREVAEHTRTLMERRRVEGDLRALTAELEQRVEAAMAERSLLAEIVESTDAFVQVVDQEFRWMAINRAAADEFERIFGIRPAIGDSMLELLQDFPEQREAVRDAWGRALAGERYTEIQEFGELDRRFYEMKFDVLRDRSGEQIGAFQFVYDVTDRLNNERRLAQTEEALRQSQKMEAMGQLTGGVAHDFNNLLTPIIGGLDMLQRRIASDERTHRILSGALASAERAQTLVQRLLAFARRQPLQPTAIDVSRLVEGMRDLIASTSGPQVKLELQIEDDLPPARADANQLEMALLNLAVNARDAMPDGGQLTIQAAVHDIADGQSRDLRPGRYLRITVRDTGIGMDEATLRKAVEPFFSTKGIGRGTGLGLSMVHGLAAQLNGALQLESTLGAGTAVMLFLPTAEIGPSDAQPVAETHPAHGGGTVLLADDEELVRASTAEMLRELGYGVVQVDSADAALKRVNAGLSPDIVITDHLMPGTTGAELAQILRRQRPELPVLVITGYANLEGIPSEIARLTKPFRQSDLVRSLAALTGTDQESPNGNG